MGLMNTTLVAAVVSGVIVAGLFGLGAAPAVAEPPPPPPSIGEVPRLGRLANLPSIGPVSPWYGPPCGAAAGGYGSMTASSPCRRTRFTNGG